MFPFVTADGSPLEKVLAVITRYMYRSGEGRVDCY